MRLIQKAKNNLKAALFNQVQSVLYTAYDVVQDLMGEQAPSRDEFLWRVKTKMEPSERSE